MRIATQIGSAQQLQNAPLAASDARRQLRGMACRLVNSDTGAIRSGYLRLTRSGDLNAGGIFTGGRTTNASQSVKTMILQAYGNGLSPLSRLGLENALDAYLTTTGQAIGTRSFVKLINTLENKLPDDDFQSPLRWGTQNITSRLDLIALHTETREQINQFIDGWARDPGNRVSASAVKQFRDLAQVWEHPPESFTMFRRVMFPETSALNNVSALRGPEAPRTFAMGDADGSMGRMVLHAIASGVAELPTEHMPALARVMHKEMLAVHKNDLAAFQADPEIRENLDEIAGSLIVKPNPQDGNPACIFLGDILSDRFTNNQQAMSAIIHKLSGVDPQNPRTRVDTGVRFIAGNHDTVPLLTTSGRERLNRSDSDGVQWGSHAAKKLGFDQYRDLLRNCFNAADYSGGVLSTHNGVARGLGDNDYLVAVGNPTDREEQDMAMGGAVDDATRLTAGSPQELANKMNTLFHEMVGLGFLDNAISTDFRPDDRDMTPAALRFGRVPGFRQLHGHHAEANEDHPGVTNLNARGIEGFRPVAKVIEYSPNAPGDAGQ